MTDHDRWSHLQPLTDLRLRCALRFDCPASNTLAIDGTGRKRLKDGLADSTLARFVAVLAERRGLHDGPLTWERTPDSEGYNDRRSPATERS